MPLSLEETGGSIKGLCTSAGTLGPSISFGKSDAASVISSNAALADCAATLLGNLITERTEKNILSAIQYVSEISGVEGAMAVAGEHISIYGSMPTLNPQASVSMITLGNIPPAHTI